MSRMYADEQVILDLDYLVCAQVTCRGGQWMLDVLLALGEGGQTLTLVYATMATCQAALCAMRRLLEEEDILHA